MNVRFRRLCDGIKWLGAAGQVVGSDGNDFTWVTPPDLGDPVTVPHGGTGTANGSITGTDTLTFAAGGTDKNVALTPSGAGYTLLNGSVGLGTATPQARFHVFGGGTPLAIFQATAPSPYGVFVCLDATQAAGGHDWRFGSTAAGAGEGQGKFLIIDQTAGVNRLVIDTAGNLGIGTTSPTSKLQLVGLIVYANNAAAVAAGLTAGAFYRTGGDPDLVCVVH